MLNHIVVMGRLTRDPELRTTQSGVNVASFTVAVDRDFGGRDGAERQTDFFDCAAWRQTGEFVSKYFQKGRMIVVSGRMQSRKYQDREGNNRTAWEIQADNVYFGDSKRDSDNAGYSQSSYTGQSSYSRGSDSPRQSAPVPPVTPSPFEELEDDGELPF
ncbi:MAG: single-stranded DNA-binding protein [Eubacteriales bacterium]|nr:single-stranded DNA-binding protein [Oscillospiraceae bacterium]MBQ5787145.1 single-stranded DNA-binding protein [Oscillospiraceae bacterium]MBQ6611514.1 single-stranded DNA-binding protein [Oscillospiraceae bacterium]MBR3237477.1 single-stranded DNA-binding protein [Oscillospiraceae bacterium]MDO5459541.1 single-stranded DNA-binding protein [Eubacteriales bacterium]